MNRTLLKIVQSNFLRELQNAYAGKKTSFRFILHEIARSSVVKNGEIFQAIIIGGTVAKTATLRKNGTNFEILNTQQYHVSFKTEEKFLAFVENKIGKDINVIALNFAYPMTPVFENGRLDGKLISTSKEGAFYGLIGKKIGQEIEGYVFKKRKKKIIVSVANDTICLLLSGLTKYSFGNLAAGIVGTGLNFAFFINRNTLVNLESASFDKFTQSPEGVIINKQSLLPGRGLFEKETSGAYLYKHFNIIIKKKNINHKPISSTEELNSLCHPEFISGSRFAKSDAASLEMLKPLQEQDFASAQQVQHDMVRVSGIARKLLARSAQLVACQIAGITEFKKSNMVFNMEGSLFWKGNEYKETILQTVKQLVPKHSIEFAEIKDSGIIGAAKLVS